MGGEELIRVDRAGLACPAGGFHIDPWRPVPVAAVTHAHTDHARPGSGRYLAAAAGVALLRRRLGPDAAIRGVPYGEPLELGGVQLSFHPAGHVLGSAQVRVERGGETWVVSGDYKRQGDPTCEPFEVVPCHTFVTEATFGLPVYRWPPVARVAGEILAWWEENRSRGWSSVLLCYALGKAQRILGELARLTDRQVYLHGALAGLVGEYRRAGVELLPTACVGRSDREGWGGELILAPPSALRSSWLRRFAPVETAFASGWMRLRSRRRGWGVERGFVLSDHADWDALLRTVEESGARRVFTTHGYAEPLARFLREERGLQASALRTRYGEEED